jgi:hypothetical protein
MKPYMRDYRVGEVKKPEIPLAKAVAASSAFPPVLSPVELRLDPSSFTPNSGQDLQRKPFTSRVFLADVDPTLPRASDFPFPAARVQRVSRQCRERSP